MKRDVITNVRLPVKLCNQFPGFFYARMAKLFVLMAEDFRSERLRNDKEMPFLRTAISPSLEIGFRISSDSSSFWCSLSLSISRNMKIGAR